MAAREASFRPSGVSGEKDWTRALAARTSRVTGVIANGPGPPLTFHSAAWIHESPWPVSSIVAVIATVEPTCTTGQQCHPTTMGEFVCVTPPPKACSGKAQCDGLTLETCAGNATDGYVVVSSMACPTRCEVRLDGTTACD